MWTHNNRYALTEANFAHILTVFPLFVGTVKVAALNTYRDVERALVLAVRAETHEIIAVTEN